MNASREAAANPAPAAVLERPDARIEEVPYFHIDFHRCVIRRGTRAKPSVKGPSRVKAG